MRGAYNRNRKSASERAIEMLIKMGFVFTGF